MTSQRQILANRRNAGRSTGPRSSTGKGRSSKNSLKHGLSVNLRAIGVEQIELLAHAFEGDQADERTRERARKLARATVDLERVTQYKLSLTERIILVGRLNRSYWPNQLDPIIFTIREMRQIDRALKGGRRPRLRRVNPPLPLPPDEPARLSEAFRRALPELLAIERYERVFLARFTGTLRSMFQTMPYAARQG
jgi:hypothetical protein